MKSKSVRCKMDEPLVCFPYSFLFVSMVSREERVRVLVCFLLSSSFLVSW